MSRSHGCSTPCRLLELKKILRLAATRLSAIRSSWGGKRNQRTTPRQKNLKMRSVFTRGLKISTQYPQPARNRVFSFLKPTRRPYHMRASTCSENVLEKCLSKGLSRMEATARIKRGSRDLQISIPTSRIPQLLIRTKHRPYSTCQQTCPMIIRLP